MQTFDHWWNYSIWMSGDSAKEAARDAWQAAQDALRASRAEGCAHEALRDRFAAAALTGLLAAHPQGNEEDFAKQSYLLADMLLAARAAPEQETNK